MNFELDTHTHTIASGHAYNTIREMAMAARDKGLKLLAITDHAPKMPGAFTDFYFINLSAVDRNMFGVELLMGSEVNILDVDGNVDLHEKILKNLDIVIASLHMPCINPGSREENTMAYINAMRNPYVNIIGHPDDGNFPVDYESLVKAAKENNVLIEINNSSLKPNNYRIDTRENDLELLKLCKRYNVPIVVGSDAHTDSSVGDFELAHDVIKFAEFPESLVVNCSTDELKKYVNKYKYANT